jgi:hypothetical protein
MSTLVEQSGWTQVLDIIHNLTRCVVSYLRGGLNTLEFLSFISQTDLNGGHWICPVGQSRFARWSAMRLARRGLVGSTCRSGRQKSCILLRIHGRRHVVGSPWRSCP